MDLTASFIQDHVQLRNLLLCMPVNDVVFSDTTTPGIGATLLITDTFLMIHSGSQWALLSVCWHVVAPMMCKCKICQKLFIMMQQLAVSALRAEAGCCIHGERSELLSYCSARRTRWKRSLKRRSWTSNWTNNKMIDTPFLAESKNGSIAKN